MVVFFNGLMVKGVNMSFDIEVISLNCHIPVSAICSCMTSLPFLVDLVRIPCTESLFDFMALERDALLGIYLVYLYTFW